MSARRGIVTLAALLPVLVAMGCVSTVAGSGRFGAAGAAPSQGAPASPSTTPGDDAPATSPSAGPSGGTVAAPEVCSLWTAQELRTIFGEPVTVGKGVAAVSCDFTTKTAGMSVSIHDFLNLNEEAKSKPDGEETTIQGLPGWVSDSEILVARAPDPAAAGLIFVSHYYPPEQGTGIGMKLLERIVPKYKK